MERAMLKGSLIFSTGHSQSEVTTQGGCQGNNYPKYLDLISLLPLLPHQGHPLDEHHQKSEGKEPKINIREKGGEYICRGKLTISGTQCLTEGLSKQVETSNKINANNNCQLVNKFWFDTSSFKRIRKRIKINYLHSMYLHFMYI